MCFSLFHFRSICSQNDLFNVCISSNNKFPQRDCKRVSSFLLEYVKRKIEKVEESEINKMKRKERINQGVIVTVTTSKKQTVHLFN